MGGTPRLSPFQVATSWWEHALSFMSLLWVPRGEGGGPCTLPVVLGQAWDGMGGGSRYLREERARNG